MLYLGDRSDAHAASWHTVASVPNAVLICEANNSSYLVMPVLVNIKMTKRNNAFALHYQCFI